MKKLIKNNYPIILFVTAVLLVSSIFIATIARVAYSERTINHVQPAAFSVTIDGVPTQTMNYKLLATTKVTDIQQEEGVYVGNSFIAGAYQSNSIVIHNDSEVKTQVALDFTCTADDDRIFYVVLPNCSNEQVMYAELYSKIGGEDKTLAQIRDICNEYNNHTYDLGYDDNLRLTLVVWSEHNSVYVDNNADGVADEAGKKLSQLADGVPAEEFEIKCYVVQKD